MLDRLADPQDRKKAEPAATAQRGRPSFLWRFICIRNYDLAWPAWLILNVARMQNRGLENCPADIVDWIVGHFEADAVPSVHLLLQELGSDRLSRCALFLSRASIAGLKQAVDLGKTDWRDLIVAAEYDRKDNHLRDFNQPFPPDEKGA